MARGNLIYMMGRVQENPIIKINKDGEYCVGRMTLLTVRRSGMNSKQQLAGEIRCDEQLIMSRTPWMIEHRIAEVGKGDIVMIKGSLSAREIIKKVKCPYCGEIASESMGVIVYIDPIAVMKIKEAGEISDDEIIKFLTKNVEFSNYAMFFGTLVREPRYSLDYEGTNRKETNIQIALNRKRMIIEDGPDKRTDYPYVRAFGRLAEETSKVLHTGSEIYIEGAIETREIEMSKKCESCNEEFYAEGTAVEIVPYSVEYINNIDTSVLVTPEDYENMSDELKGYVEEEMEEEYGSDEGEEELFKNDMDDTEPDFSKNNVIEKDEYIPEEDDNDDDSEDSYGDEDYDKNY